MFRVSHRHGAIDDADTIEGTRGIVRGQSPGRYEVDEIRGGAVPIGAYVKRLGESDPTPGRDVCWFSVNGTNDAAR
jgi:hypothetical protein